MNEILFALGLAWLVYYLYVCWFNIRGSKFDIKVLIATSGAILAPLGSILHRNEFYITGVVMVLYGVLVAISMVIYAISTSLRSE